ncbi:PQQ-dependent sugar dehydrogenase [Patulibacter defluvii]|uniref:PQQ-dependent sugar dehydrogenase n=1 Tax=Patulibacter defluvii TaxID=3095358 RepID=UPI002A75E137|nr:PQQ-dependent sugar dehydrogenase [Patulibacter sp. DM4]
MRAPRVLPVLLLVLAPTALAACGEDRPVADAAERPAAAPLPRPPASAAPQPEQRAPVALRAATIARGFRKPVGVVAEPGGERLLIVEQRGTARWLGRRGPALGRPFLDVRRITMESGERGLLGVAFVPGYPRDPRVVIHHSDRRGDTRVVVAPVRDGRVVPGRARVLLRQRQPYENHKGGPVDFDRRGRLLLGLGDGGSAFDPQQRGQDRGVRLAKILRTAGPLTTRRPRWTIAAYGARNPWRFSIDRPTGDLWIADVGQDVIEEVDRLSERQLDGPKPPNLGWSAFEGNLPLAGRPRRLDRFGPLVWPVASYRHGTGRCSVTGGVVARGTGAPASLRERYLFGDFCSGELWSIPARGPVARLRREAPTAPQLTAIAARRDGRIVMTGLNGVVRELR